MPADVNSVNDEIKNEAKKVLANKTGMEKIKYFVYYYKVPFLVAVGAIALIAYIIYWYATLKDCVFRTIVVNGQIAEAFDYQSIMDDFSSRVTFDPKEEELAIEGNYQLDIEAQDQLTRTTIQKIFMYVTAQDLDILICDEDFMRMTRAQDCAGDLSKLLPQDMQDKYADNLIWYDFPIEEVGEDYYEENYAGRNEACSIDITEFKKIKESNMFEGKKVYAIIIANTLHKDTAIDFLKYLDE